MPAAAPERVFLLSPATLSGERAALLVSPRARFALAERLRRPGGVSLGDVMAFLSGLYFRGKLSYAQAFSRPPGGLPPEAGVLVITPHAGLRPAAAPVTAAELRGAARVDIRADNPRYRRPLDATARVVAEAIGAECEVVLLGSIATPKYVAPLATAFGPRLFFPLEFVGRGDMSRGGLMLRCVKEGRELTYVPIAGGVARQGPRPPRLPPRARAVVTDPTG